MSLFPLFAALHRRPCLVVGGGEVALRKVRQLLRSGAQVTVNAPEISPDLETLATEAALRLERRPFAPALVAEHWLVIAATDDPAVNRAVAAAADAALRFCNVVDSPGESSFISPSVVDRSPLVVAVSSGGASPVLARLVRQQLEQFLPARLGELAGWAARWRGEVRARLPGLTPRRRFWEGVLAGPLSRHVLAGRTAAADADMAAALANLPTRTPWPVDSTTTIAGYGTTAGAAGASAQDRTANAPGTHAAAVAAAPVGEAWLVGAGPGDPELLTLKGFQVLQQAEVVLYDRLVGPGVLDYARRDAELIPVGKTGGGPSTPQAQINALLVERVARGQRVCRLKGGDPLVFGRGGEEAAALAAAGLPFQIVPGITAALGCGAYAGIPLTHRGLASAVVLATGDLAGGARSRGGAAAAGDATDKETAAGEPATADGPAPDWALLARPGSTAVIYMATRSLGQVARALVAAGRPATTPAAVVSAGTLAEQQVVTTTLAELVRHPVAVAPPAVLIVGDVVGLAATLAWFDPTSAGPGDNAGPPLPAGDTSASAPVVLSAPGPAATTAAPANASAASGSS